MMTNFSLLFSRTYLFAALLVVFILVSCAKIPPYDGEVHEKQAMAEKLFTTFTHSIQDQDVFGAHTGERSKPALLFIHGTPGDWRAWGNYLGDKDLSKHAFMISIDRPGFAKSKSNTGAAVTDLKDQARFILEAVKKEHKGPFVLVGHSYGGPVAIQMALDYPNDVSSMLILAGAFDPEIQKSRWYHRIATTQAGKTILPKPIYNAGQEMMSLPAELQAQQPRLKDIRKRVILIQGGKDWLVPKGNAQYVESKFTNADLEIIKLPKQGHFIPWEQHDLVKEKILTLLKK